MIAWSLFMLTTWVIFVYCTQVDLLVLGLYTADNPVQLCETTIRGRKLQLDLIPTKVKFVFFAYFSTFFGSVVYAIFHLRRFQKLDSDESTMRDYAVMLTNIPEVPGSEKLEEELETLVRE